MPPTTLRIHVGALADPAQGDVVVALPAGHPMRAGLLSVEIDVDDVGAIAAARVDPGPMHRGVEKLFEVRDYRQGLALADRHDWQSPASGELSLALAVERALGIEVPLRAQWLRMVAAEHARLHSHLGFLTWLPARLAVDVPAIAGVREGLRGSLQQWTGNRLHPMLVRIGGVAEDIDRAWWEAEAELAAECLGISRTLRTLLASTAARDLAGLGVLDRAAVDGYGLTGPVARAAGLARDVRRDQPYLRYAQLTRSLDPGVSGGDALARFRVLVEEVRIAAGVLIDALGTVEDLAGPIATRLPTIIRLPEGTHYAPVEAPLGEAGLRIASRGEKTPWRVFLRTPSLPNAMALERALVGVPLDRASDVVASLPWVIGDVAK